MSQPPSVLYLVRVVPVLFSASILFGCGLFTRPDVDVLDGLVIPARCEPAIQFSGRTVDIQGVKLPLHWGTFTLPVEIGKFYTDRKSIQEATSIAQILDSRRVENCRLLQTLRNIPA